MNQVHRALAFVNLTTEEKLIKTHNPMFVNVIKNLGLHKDVLSNHEELFRAYFKKRFWADTL